MTGEEWIRIEPAADGLVVVAPEGDVDMSRSPELRSAIQQAIAEHKPDRLVIDLSGVAYMDSSGLATLVEAMKTSKAAGATMALCEMTEKVRAIFEIARLHQFFTIFQTRDAAMTG